MIEFYKEFGDLGYLANYSNHGFTKNGVFYKTVEHYYQSEKFSDPEIKKRIIDADTPKEASNIGRDRSLKRIDDFKSIKNQVMFDGILEKFRQHRDIAYKLIETRNKGIAEATVDEYYWGCVLDQNRKTTENINIVNKEDKPGIDIIVKPGTKKEFVHIPVMITESGVEDLVYNDFYIGKNADV